MALATINTVERFGRGRLFLVARPSADPGANNTARLTGYKALIYATGDTGTTLKSGVLEYCQRTSDGLNVKIKQNVIESDPDNGSKHPVGISDTETDLEFSFTDMDAAHVADVFGLAADEVIAVAAASGKAGRSFALVGGQSVLTPVVGCYQMPSPIVSGQFDNILFPRLQLYGDVELKLNKKGLIDMKAKGKALEDTYIVNANGFGESVVFDFVTAAPLT